MARIRTVKPEFFRHEGLQDIESANPGAYSMLVFSGLWGHCDKLGRFEWKPRTLKLDILPFIDFDMSETLDILWLGGFIRRYKNGGKEYGEISSFEKHQRISGKEAQEPEKHPEPTEYIDRSNGEATGKQSGLQEGKGMEGKGREEERSAENDALRARSELSESVFDFWKQTLGHPRAILDTKRRKLIESRLKDGYTDDDLKAAILGCSLSPFHMGQNDKGTKYDGLDLILRDAQKVDQFIGFSESPPVIQQNQPAYKTASDKRKDFLNALTGRNEPEALPYLDGESRHVA